MNARCLLLLLLLMGAACLSGCATTGTDDVSTIPWNRPESWEGMGALGGFGGFNRGRY
jgi:hypothetical protein